MGHGLTGCIGAVLLVAASASASASPALAGGQGEIGYQQGALGVSAILAADYRTAETQLNSLNGVTPRDPLRLINLGNVYAGTGRPADAEKAYLAVFRTDPVEVTTADGRITTTYAVARTALGRLRAAMASR